ncbi:MAG: hypothetical protein AAB576_10300 [Elusimicrobiota bacterium]
MRLAFEHQWDAARDYNPSPGLQRIQAALLAVNAADDERNPPGLGILEREIKRLGMTHRLAATAIVECLIGGANATG